MQTTDTKETATATAAEQPCMANVEAQKEHQWLQKMLGEWTAEGEAVMGPDQPPSQWKATETVRKIGEIWVAAEGTGDMPDGSPSKTVMTLGYDTQKKKYVGTFIGSMMTNLWVYEGELDASGKVLTLDAEGPSMSGDGKMAKYKDAIEFKSDDYRVMTSKAIGPDGQWHQFMTAHYRRKK